MPEIFVPEEHSVGMIAHRCNDLRQCWNVGEIDVQCNGNRLYVSHDPVEDPEDLPLLVNALEEWDQIGSQLILDCKESTWSDGARILELIDGRDEKKGSVSVSSSCLNFLSLMRGWDAELELGWICDHKIVPQLQDPLFDFLKALRISFVSLDKTWSMGIGDFREHGLQVYLYTVNSLSEWEKFRNEPGLTAVFTDNP